MALEITFQASLPSIVPGVNIEQIGPVNLSIDGGVEAIRRTKVLSAADWFTLDVGDASVVPWFWFLVCIHATNSVDVGFGQSAPMLLEPGGPPAIWTGADIPMARGHGGESKLLYCVITKTA